MRIDLFFPPFDYSVLIPELGVPMLTAASKKAGHEVRQLDLNQEFIRSHLGELRTYAPLLEAIESRSSAHPVDETDDPRALLERIAARLVSIDGTAHDYGGEPFDYIRRQERLVDKSCHLSASQVTTDWSAASDEGMPPLLGALARHGARSLRFRRDLLRMLHHLYFTPTSYGVDAVLRAATRDDAVLSPFFAQVLNRLFGQREPDLVGVSIWSTPQLIPALMLARAIRQRLPRAHLVAGGAWCTYAQDRIVATRELFSLFDSFAIHEATDTLLELCRRVEAGGDGRNLPGLLTIHHPTDAPIAVRPPPDFDDTELPDYDGLDVGHYPMAKLALRLHRGCHWARCVFCTHACHPYAQRYSFDKKTRLSSRLLARVADHVELVKQQYGIDDFTMADNLVSPGIMLQLAELVRERELGITWDSLARFEPEYTTGFCRQLAQGGCQRLDLGLETAHNEGLRHIHKGIDTDLVLDNLHHLKAAGIGTKVFVVHYAGQPPEEYDKTLRFLVQHQELIDEVAISRFSVARNTNAYRAAESLPFALSDDGDLDVFAVPYEVSEGLSLDALIELTRRYFPHYW